MVFSGGGALQAQNALGVNPVTVFLNGTVGGPAVQQSFAVTSTIAAVSFTATFSNASWLTLTPTSGTTPAHLTLTANLAGLSPGVFHECHPDQSKRNQYNATGRFHRQ